MGEELTGEIFGADIEINTFDHTMVAAAPSGSEWDLQSIMTHEAGHFLGMGHSEVRQAVMFTPFDKGRERARALFADDVAGISQAYRPDGSRAVLDGQITEGGACEPLPRGGLTRNCEPPADVAGCILSPREARDEGAPNDGLWLAAPFLAACVARRWRRPPRRVPKRAQRLR